MRFICFLLFFVRAVADVLPGVDVFFDDGHYQAWKEKRIGLLTNQTGVDRQLHPTLERFLEKELQVVALFSPEHGFHGNAHASERVGHQKLDSLPVYSLHGETRRPTSAMLQGLDAIVYDIQCVGVRPYTYETTLFYVMEEAAKAGVEVVVLDRPNPVNGVTVDGPMLDASLRSFIGYVNVPYCHGMTIGELARFFNEEYKVGCSLTVIPIKGWDRNMSFSDTGLTWIPPSPNIPEADTPHYLPTTGSLGEFREFLNIGIGYTLPFKIIGAPWIRANEFAQTLNEQKLPGVTFIPYHFKPFYGAYKGQECQGVLIRITDPTRYRPIAVQYLLLGILKSLYPKEVEARLPKDKGMELFNKANGTAAIYSILMQERFPAWKLIQYQQAERDAFLEKRKLYLLY